MRKDLSISQVQDTRQNIYLKKLQSSRGKERVSISHLTKTDVWDPKSSSGNEGEWNSEMVVEQDFSVQMGISAWDGNLSFALTFD